MSFIRPFISPTQGLLLRTLYTDKNRGWSQHDLARHLGVARETLRDDLHALERARVVKTEQVGRKKLYQPHPSCPIHGELKSMLAKSYGIVEEIGALLAPFRSGIKWAFVQDFGIDLENAEVEPVAHVIGIIDYDELRPRWYKMMNRLNRVVAITYHALPFFEQHVRLRHPVAIGVINCEKIWLQGDPEALQRLKRQRPRKGDQFWGPPPSDRISRRKAPNETSMREPMKPVIDMLALMRRAPGARNLFHCYITPTISDYRSNRTCRIPFCCTQTVIDRYDPAWPKGICLQLLDQSCQRRLMPSSTIAPILQSN